jgi:hypothetical protein
MEKRRLGSPAMRITRNDGRSCSVHKPKFDSTAFAQALLTARTCKALYDDFKIVAKAREPPLSPTLGTISRRVVANQPRTIFTGTFFIPFHSTACSNTSLINSAVMSVFNSHARIIRK